MTLRDKIAEIIDREMIDSMGDYSSVADAILAALPDMVAPLVWYETHHKSPEQLGYRASAMGINYVIISALTRKNCILSSGGNDYIGPFHFDNVETAKAAANTHHAAAVVAALTGASHD